MGLEDDDSPRPVDVISALILEELSLAVRVDGLSRAIVWLASSRAPWKELAESRTVARLVSGPRPYIHHYTRLLLMLTGLAAVPGVDESYWLRN